MNETITQLNISALTEQYVESGIVDPHDMAEKALEELSEEELRDITERYLASVFRTAVGTRRSRYRHKRKSSKWDAAQAAHAILLQPECINGTWKTLGQLTIPDLQITIMGYEARARHNRNEAERRQRLIRKMQREKADHVAQLDPLDVVKILEAVSAS